MEAAIRIQTQVLLKEFSETTMVTGSEVTYATTLNEAKLLSLLKGLQLAWERRIPKLVIKTDTSTVYDWMTNKENAPPELEEEVQRCKEVLHKNR